MFVHKTADTLDGIAELPDTQTSQQTDVNETYKVPNLCSRIKDITKLTVEVDLPDSNFTATNLITGRNIADGRR